MITRHRSYFPRDDAPLQDGDVAFVGVNERAHPAQLPPGYVARGTNTRFTRGVAEPRRGIGILRCGPTDGVNPWTEVYGVAEFYDQSDGLTWIVVAADSGVFRTRPNNVAQTVPMNGVTLTAATFEQFVVCKNVLVMLRGPDAPPLACRQLSEGFQSITMTATGDGTTEIPNSSFGIYFANRLIVIYDRDKVAVSDDGDYTRYTQAIASFQINEGDNDQLVAMSEFDANTLLFFKSRSVWKVTNIGGDIAQAVGPLEVTRQYGCVAPFSIARVGRDVYWWSQIGLISVGLTEQNEVRTQTVAITRDMPVTVARINPIYLDQIRVAYHDGFLYAAVPLDDAILTGPNLVTGSYGATAAADVFWGTDYGLRTVSGLTAGVNYQLTLGAADLALENGSQVLYGSVRFTAVAATATLRGTPSAVATASVAAITATGVNTGVMVYDTTLGAWSSCDESDALAVEQWFKATVLGDERLCFLSTDGWLRLYDDDYEDELLQAVAAPYVDLVLFTWRWPDDTIQINGGTLVSVKAVQAWYNPPTTGDWGATFPAYSGPQAASNLWELANVGYNPAATLPWTAPNTTPSRIGHGLRFTATNGVLPQVKVNGVAVTTAGIYGSSGWEWLFVDPHSGNEIQRVPVTMMVRTRAYPAGGPVRKRYQRAKCSCSTWNPTYTIKSIVDGVNEEDTRITAKTLSRTAHHTVQAAWVNSNAGDDHGDPYRQDYSVVLPALGMNLDPTGANFEQHQDVVEAFEIPARGEWLQLQFNNTTGRLELRAVDLEAIPHERANGTFA